MKLSELKKDIKAIITNVSCERELKQRFNSFGLIKGSIIEIEEISLARNTIALVVDNTSIALRLEEAKSIEVEIVQ